MKKVIIGIVVIIILAGIYFGVGWFVASKLTEESGRHIDITAQVISPDYDDVEFKSTDGLLLKGWLFKGSSDKVIIMVAGVLDNRTNRGYYGELITKDLIESGYNVLLYDTRARGESEGMVRGKDEQHDIIGAVNFLEQKGFKSKNIGIIAYSSGATATIMAIEDLTGIGPIVIDSAPARFQKAISHILTAEQGLPSFFLPGVFFMLKTVYGIDASKINPVEKIPQVPDRVFLFVHGGLDTSIPPENSKEMLKLANKESKLIIFPNGDHVMTYRSDPDLYRKEVFGFLDEEFDK